ncbi:MAG TPA: hypothetical protein VFG69_21615 [Nannocystaceae bacterium]|nr:hypothetical protein [Nannocystaceae bacterium]
MPFAYYRRLTRSQQATYRKSDAVTAMTVKDGAGLRALVPAIEAGLAADDRKATQLAVRRFTAALCEDQGAAPLVVRVLARRPSSATSELHGLYERDEDGSAVIRVWMRTAAHSRVVAFRTFVRTLLHELCHHFDFECLDLVDTFHTEGFFRRESSLARQLLPARERRQRADAAPVPDPMPVPDPESQLDLFG